MKKTIFIFLLVFSLSVYSQNILWEQVGLKVNPGTENFVLELVDSFYTSIEKPENVAISLDAVWYRPEGFETTHYLTFAGSAEDLGKLRELRSGSAYDQYNQNFLNFAEITSISSGGTLMRFNVEKGNYPISQMWRFSVEDPETFANEFVKLIKEFPSEGYLSIGLISQGSDGDSHYIYTTHKDYATALSWGPKTEGQQNAFMKFQKTVNPISDYLGTITMNNIKTWN